MRLLARLFVCLIFLALFLAKLTEVGLVKSTNPWMERVTDPLLVPFATLMIAVLLSSRIALFGSVFLSVVLSIGLAVNHSKFLILNLITSLIVIACTRNLRKRKEVFTIFGKAGLGAMFLCYLFTLSENHFWSASLLVELVSSGCFQALPIRRP